MTFKYRDFSDENLSNIKNLIQNINWHPVLINNDADVAYDLFQSILLSTFNMHFPLQIKIFFIMEKENVKKEKFWKLLKRYSEIKKR